MSTIEFAFAFHSDKVVICIHEKVYPSVKGSKTKPTMIGLHRHFAGSELEPHSLTFSRNKLKQPGRDPMPIENMALYPNLAKKMSPNSFRLVIS